MAEARDFMPYYDEDRQRWAYPSWQVLAGNYGNIGTMRHYEGLANMFPNWYKPGTKFYGAEKAMDGKWHKEELPQVAFINERGKFKWYRTPEEEERREELENSFINLDPWRPQQADAGPWRGSLFKNIRTGESTRRRDIEDWVDQWREDNPYVHDPLERRSTQQPGKHQEAFSAAAREAFPEWQSPSLGSISETWANPPEKWEAAGMTEDEWLYGGEPGGDEAFDVGEIDAGAGTGDIIDPNPPAGSAFPAARTRPRSMTFYPVNSSEEFIRQSVGS